MPIDQIPPCSKLTGPFTTKANEGYRVVPYHAALESDWNRVLELADNATLMHRRSYLAYHGDSFDDCSVMIYRGNEPLAVFPAHREGEEVHSHKGLSYAGLIHRACSFNQKLQLYIDLLEYYENLGTNKISIKETPEIYNQGVGEGNSYLFHHAGARQVQVELSQTVVLPLSIRHKGRKANIKQALRAGLEVKEDVTVDLFWETLLLPNLSGRHGVRPTHSKEQMGYLKGRHPEAIRQFIVYFNKEAIAGATVYLTSKCLHTQYLATNAKGRQLHALDLLVDHLSKGLGRDRTYLDFGHSNEANGQRINWGLFHWKESFGAKTFAMRHFILPTKGWRKLNEVFEHSSDHIDA
jgi:hypothetical protein